MRRVKSIVKFRTFWLATLILMVALLSLASAAPTRAQADSMSVPLMDAQQRIVGSAMMSDMGDGMVQIEVQIEGMNPVPGDHLFGVAEMGMCEAPGFESAGALEGAFPNVQFYASGTADYKVVVEGFDMASLMDADGSALVLYADTDMESARIICGVAAYPGEAAEEEEMEEPIEEPVEEPVEEPIEEEIIEDDEEIDDGDASEFRTFIEYLEDGAGVFIYDANGRIVGISLMFTDDFGYTDIELIIEDMDPVPGDHVMAISENGQCDTPDFTSAGDDEYVFDETVQFFANGSADFYTYVDAEDLDVRDLFDSNGSALVLYADKHDNPGPRINCGAILPFPDFIETLGLTVEDFAALLLSDN